jgi:uncharacterized OB-fold protein
MDAAPRIRMLVELNDDNRGYWTGGANGDLLIARCQDCSTYLHPPLPKCPYCWSDAVVPEKVSGRGRVYSYTINHRAWVPDIPVPYVVALVEIEEQEGVHLATNIIDCAPEDVTMGMEVEVVFEAVEDQFVPLFRPRRV